MSVSIISLVACKIMGANKSPQLPKEKERGVKQNESYD
jgi:hypothetical protein